MRRDGARLLSAGMNRFYGYDEREKAAFEDVLPGEPDYEVIQNGARMGMFEKGGSFNPNDELTRLTLSRWLVDAMGYREVAQMGNTVSSSFKDIGSLTQVEKNYLGLGQGLGLMQGDSGGMFRPGDSLTWEELAAVVLKASPKLRARMEKW